MADAGTSKPADRWHAHIEEESAFGTLNGGFPAAANAIRVEAGSTYSVQKIEIPDETFKEDDGADESGAGDPEVTASLIVKAEGNLLSGGAGAATLSQDTALSQLVKNALAADSTLYSGDVSTAGPHAADAVTQTGGTAQDFATGSVGVFVTTAGPQARHISTAAGGLLTLSMELSSIPAPASVIYGTTVIPIERSHDGNAEPTLQIGIKDPNQEFNAVMLGIGCNGMEIQDAAKGANRNIKFDLMGADYTRGGALAVTQPAASRGRSGTNRQLWLAPVGVSQVATCFNVFNFSWMSGHNTTEDPTCGTGLANNGYSYQLAPSFTFEVYEDAAPIGGSTDLMEAWEDGLTDFQMLFQMGRTAGRISGLDLQNVFLTRPVRGNQNNRRTFVCTGFCKTGTAANFGNWFQA